MAQIDQTMRGIHHVDREKGVCSRENSLHPLSKLMVTIIYMMFVVSFGKYNIAGLLSMFVYPFAMMILYDIPINLLLERLKTVFFFVFLMGAVNPFFDKVPIAQLLGITISGGVVSMCTLWLKAVLTVLGGYILMELTTMDQICYSLRCLHVPSLFVVTLALIYRYLMLMIKEVNKITTAYKLRAPGQKGIHISVWGSLLGNLLLRTVDRGQLVYESMMLRGFSGSYYYDAVGISKASSLAYTFIWIFVLTAFRFFPVFSLIGQLHT